MISITNLSDRIDGSHVQWNQSLRLHNVRIEWLLFHAVIMWYSMS